MNRLWQVAGGPFVVLTHVHQDERMAALQFLLHVADGHFSNSCLRIVHDIEELRCVCHGSFMPFGFEGTRRVPAIDCRYDPSFGLVGQARPTASPYYPSDVPAI